MTPIACAVATTATVVAAATAAAGEDRGLKAMHRNTIASVTERSRPVSATLQSSGVEAAPLEQSRERGVTVAEALYGAAHSFEGANAMRKRSLQLAGYL